MRINPAAIAHAKYAATRKLFGELVASSPGDLVIVLVGPTQVGKSEIFRETVQRLKKATASARPGAVPVVEACVATTQTGRISPKYVAIKLLECLKHPMYLHLAALDEADRYRPHRGLDETTIRLALDQGLHARQTMFAGLDELHHVTHTGNERLRADVLQSLKCLAAPGRTFFGAGGYELAYRGFFDSAHFCGRLVIVEFPRYTDCASDLLEWARILKTIGMHLPLATPSLLVDHCNELLDATCGSFGVLEKHLWQASVSARVLGQKLRWRDIAEVLPGKKQRDTILADILKGEAALDKMPHAHRVAGSPGAPARKPKKNRPFETSPQRRSIGDLEVVNG
jgi:hypothetical protein